jgi:predicted DNA-binding protein
MSKKQRKGNKEVNVLGALQAASRAVEDLVWDKSNPNNFNHRRAIQVREFIEAAINVWIDYSLADYTLVKVEKDDETGQPITHIFRHGKNKGKHLPVTVSSLEAFAAINGRSVEQE